MADGLNGEERAGVAQRFGAGRLIELGEIYDSACAGESVGNDRFSLSSKATMSAGRLNYVPTNVLQHAGDMTVPLG